MNFARLGNVVDELMRDCQVLSFHTCMDENSATNWPQLTEFQASYVGPTLMHS